MERPATFSEIVRHLGCDVGSSKRKRDEGCHRNACTRCITPWLARPNTCTRCITPWLDGRQCAVGPTLSTSIACQSLPIPIREGHSLPLHGTAVADPASKIHHLLSSVLCLFQWAMVYHHLSLMAMLLYHYLCLMRWVTG